MSEAREPTTFDFKAEVKQLLHLMVHSLYSNKEIFLRELISNASDANDRLRFESLSQPELLDDDPELGIRVALDPDAGTLTVSDNGIGMSRDEIVEQLGTIAHSGTARFLESLDGKAQKDSALIGQFGVGFYSSFIVAEQVEVLSRRAGADAGESVRWASTGDGSYTLEPAEKEARGTTITLTLKPDEKEFLESYRVSALIRKYSDHIAFPVTLGTAGKKDEFDDSVSDEPINKAKALWARPRTEVEDEEYVEFYKHIAHDFKDPLIWSHNRVEGRREYTSLLYVPSAAPWDLWNRESPRGVKLYVQRVFITDEATQFLPLYLRFIRGVVDSGDLSLNVSRELLQQDPVVGVMKSALTKRVLATLERLAKDETEKYATFWKEFGVAFKEGLAEDPGNREKIAALLRFNSTASEDLSQDRSLDDYLEAAGEEQDAVYFLIADTPEAACNSPHLEALRERGIEVLLLSDRIDEWVMQHLTEYKGKSFRDVARGELDLGKDEPDKKIEAELTKEHKALLKRIKRVLRDEVDEVRASDRLKESAACLVIGEQDLGFQMRELLKATGQDPPETAPSLEINLDHPLVCMLSETGGENRFEDLSRLLLEQATLVEGRPLAHPAAFVRRVNSLLLGAGPVADQG
jgi:molecular chaperone HtpG